MRLKVYVKAMLSALTQKEIKSNINDIEYQVLIKTLKGIKKIKRV